MFDSVRAHTRRFQMSLGDASVDALSALLHRPRDLADGG